MLTEEEKKEVEGYNECKLFFTVDGIGGIIWRTNHDASHGRFEITPTMQEELEHLHEYQKYAVSLLSKFGVTPGSENDRPDGDYWKWYNHWNDWKNDMSDEVWYELDTKMSNNEDFSDMLPKDSWNKPDAT